ncbi:hypothetical protein EPUS_08130 [Endocarpon pusillum Z07020]|uniref:Major facilitator superfamily (MFS) profile domain-containing protein n=1 Tax=Endocarpon pusillum (strain Z07020 / HMAS-L-300199) TaxID=1263415 RepID=U1G9C0_ENDPU|nr:uncharacterized protein EPUS_08130 [Endocarpon pusillum Z07020]ERF74082.1 hypothetical protein EPUS_08130 [Endocarpon pusillum Z07020]
MAKAAQGSASLDPREIENEATSRQPEFTPRSTMLILGASVSLFCTLGFMNAFGVFLAYYHQHSLSHRSVFDISRIGSLGIFVLTLGAPVAGVLVDKTGPLILLAGGSTGLLCGIFATSLCTEYYQFFLAQGLLLGFSMSFLFTPALATVSRYFVRHRSLALGISVSGSSIGGIIWLIMLDRLLNNNGVSFGWTMRIVGFTMLPLLFIACLTVRSPSRTSQLDDDIAGGLHGSKGHQTDLSIAKSFTFLLMCAGMAIASLGVFAPLFYITSSQPAWAIMSLQTACAAQLSTPATRGTALGLVILAISLTDLFATPMSGELITSG